GAIHPLVRTIPRSGRRSLYIASHASRIVDWPVPEGRLLLRDLMEHATRPEFVYRHTWAVGDLVIWDNRATMHRARPYDDRRHRRPRPAPRVVPPLAVGPPAPPPSGACPRGSPASPTSRPRRPGCWRGGPPRGRSGRAPPSARRTSGPRRSPAPSGRAARRSAP